MLQTLRSSLRTAFRHTSRGFTLIEIALVLVVIGLIISGGLFAISPVIESSKTTETRQKIATVEAALLGYIITNGCLPCPATTGSIATGTAGVSHNGTAPYTSACGSGGACVNTGAGRVPWITLGLSEAQATDAWGRRMTYAVNPTLTDSNTDVARTSTGSFPTISTAAGDIVIIEDLNGTGTDLGYTSIAYVIVSHGKDGVFGETNAGTSLADTHSTPADQGQRENGDNDRRFAFGPAITRGGTTYFDDIVVFKSYQPLIISCGAGSCGNPS